MSQKRRLQARKLPTAEVTLAPAVQGDEPEVVKLRALPPPAWDELKAEYPPTDAQRGQGLEWNVATFRPALLAASVVQPDGEDPADALTASDWVALWVSGVMPAGDIDTLFLVAVNLNDRSPQAIVGKGW